MEYLLETFAPERVVALLAFNDDPKYPRRKKNSEAHSPRKKSEIEYSWLVACAN
jgi:hypothetical protein